MFWYWETMDWTTTTVTRTLYTGTVGVTQRHCSDLKLTIQILRVKGWCTLYSEATLTQHCTVYRLKGEGDLTSGVCW